MQAMVFRQAHARLSPEIRPEPVPAGHEILIRVHACGVCRTDLHVQDAELPDVHYPIVPGHQVVGDFQGPRAQRVRCVEVAEIAFWPEAASKRC